MNDQYNSKKFIIPGDPQLVSTLVVAEIAFGRDIIKPVIVAAV